jgi:SNF2 family DNA or RNA helicase
MLGRIKDMTDYLGTYGNELADRIKQNAEPLFSPGNQWNNRLYALKKKPYQAQGDAIMGLSKLLQETNSAIVVGEMGCGKSLIGASVPYVYENGGKPSRSLIMCPGHLVKKWQREVLETIPDSKARIISKLGDVITLDKYKEPEVPEYVIVSKDQAKLGYAWKPAVISRGDRYHCPDCNEQILDRGGIPVQSDYFTRNRRICTECDGALWQADNTRIRRYPLSEYIKKNLKGYFDLFIADEVHELKGGSTAQGNSFGALSGAANKTLALTGTLLGGYADDIFYVLFRMSPQSIKEENINYNEISKWMARYGVLERITRSYPVDNVLSKGKRSNTTIKRKSGISPMIFSRHLLDKCAFINLEDISADLPPISEDVVRIQMDDELQEGYGDLEARLSSAVKSALTKGSKALLGTYLNTLLAYPDRPFGNEPVVYPGTNEVIAVPQNLPEDRIYNKEKELIDLVKKEVSQNRKVFTYCQYTGVKDITSRLQELFYNEGIEADVLRYTVKPEKREEWINDRVKSGVQVVIANPKLVQTGLDLYDFPAMIFYQTGYSIFNLRQASRRSWRIGQDKDVKIRYLFYGDTLQEKAMQLMGSKLKASLAIEGKFSEEGLLAMTAGEAMTTAMAKALAEGLDVEGVERVWSKLNESNSGSVMDKQIVGNKVYCVDRDSVLGKKRVRRRGKKTYDPNQLWLEGLEV